MLLTEYNEEEVMELFREDGIKKGENRINDLNSRLVAENRMDDLVRATKDPEYQKQLMKEFGIE
jgi:hypothetical protein